jgi:formamidopyrimidine-DNA glycosylase
MPELPDVEGFRRYLARYALRRKIRQVRVLDPTQLRNATERMLRHAVTGRYFRSPARHGKWLIAPVDGVTLLMHFGMTGTLKWTARPEPPHPHDRLMFVLAGGVLRYRNLRKFGGIWLARSAAEVKTLLQPLGPDALRVSRDEFQDRLADSRARLKAALMDQRLVAGLGNLLVDEILWQAMMNPLRSAATLTTGERGRLFTVMRRVLAKSVPTGRVPGYASWLTGARRPGGDCPRCGRVLRRAKLATRTSYWCPRCQAD